jgi:putative ABC transport system permease protein
MEVSMESFWQDIRFGARLLTRAPGFFLMAVAALSLGIGANTAVFSVVNGILLRPLPYPQPDRLVVIHDTQPALSTAPASYPKYIDWRDQNRVFEVIGGSAPASAVLTGSGDPVRIPVARTTATLFRVFAVQPALGRWFEEAEDHPSGPGVVVLSHGFWSRQFGSDPAILDRTITLNDTPRTVVGVMPEGFAHRGADAFVPLAMEVDENQRNSHFLATYGRLKPEVSFAQAKSEMIELGHRLAREHGNNHGIDVRLYRDVVVGGYSGQLVVLLVSVALVLLIACANVANLLLARATSRRREMAVRTAMGASRFRLARQLLRESMLLSLCGGALGLLLAYAGVRAFVASAPPVLPRMTSIAVDANVLLFTLGVAVLTGVLFGLAPILQARAGAPVEALNQETGRSSGGPASRRAANVLVVAEVALSIVLLTGAGLMVKSLTRLQQQEIGVDTERVLSFFISLPESRYDSPERARAFFETALDRIRLVPGVVAAGATSHLPLHDYGSNSYFQIEGRTLWAPSEAPLAEVRVVGGDYFKAMGVPLVRGRLFGEPDNEASPPVILINQAMANRFWPGEDPIGQRVRIFGNEPREIVGVVGDVRSYNPALEPMLEVTAPYSQVPRASMTIAVRSAGNPAALAAAMRQQIASIDPLQPLSGVQTMEEVLSRSLSRPRLLSGLFGGFALLAALLALIGVYGLMAYAVGQQRREFGIRMAMGADAGTVLRMVLRRGMGLTLSGVAIGAIAAAGLMRLLGSMLYQVTPTDPAVFALTCTGVLLAAACACYVPARAATRVDPAVTLRAS